MWVYTHSAWISVCSSTIKIYCRISRDAKSKGLVTFSRSYKRDFVKNFFQNLKKARERLRDHECSSMHAEKLGAVMSASSHGMSALLSKQLKYQQKNHRVMLMKLLDVIKYLTRQAYLYVDTMRTTNHLKAICISYFWCNQNTVRVWNHGFIKGSTFLQKLPMN